MWRYLLLPVVVLVAFEAWRLSSHESVRLRQTWEFATPDGPVTVSDVIELQQEPAVPYLPGGAVGPFRTIGRIPVSVMVSGKRYFVESNPRWWIGNGLGTWGRGEPDASLDEWGSVYTTGFIRRLRRAKATITIPVDQLPERQRRYIGIASGHNQWGTLTDGKMWLPQFETDHPGFRLLRVSYAVTDEPVDTGAPASAK